jgi:methyltransferase family protein
MEQRVEQWIASLETRHLADLTFPEVSRALRALSSAYVERRHALEEGSALSGAGKRAAFALFYGPLHFLLVAHIVRHLPDAVNGIATLVDLGCGSGAAGAAWASACDPKPQVYAIDRNAWAIDEAAKTYAAFGLARRTRQGDIARVRLPEGRLAILAAFVVNELSDPDRARLLPVLLGRGARGDRVLVVEPVGRIVGRWWDEWRGEFARAGGRTDEWRLRAELPPIVAKLDRAAGLDHRELTGRSLLVTRG